MPSTSYAIITIQCPVNGESESVIAADAMHAARIAADSVKGRVSDIRAYHEPSGSGEPIEVNLYENR